jgi:hypothetical protein
LRELGRIERTLFILDWLQSVELRRRVQVGLNKGEARNALARAVFFYRLGEIRDRSFEQQRYRASGLNLVTAAIVLWNTVYIERAINALRAHGHPVDEDLLQYLFALGLGAHQSDGKLPVAEQRQDWRGEIQAITGGSKSLTCFIFRFLRRPLMSVTTSPSAVARVEVPLVVRAPISAIWNILRSASSRSSSTSRPRVLNAFPDISSQVPMSDRSIDFSRTMVA